MPALELRDALSVVTAILTVAGVVFALRASVSKLEAGQTEIVRQVAALHKRLDHYGDQIVDLKEKHGRLDERIKSLKESQSFRFRTKLARVEAAAAGEAPMFSDEDEE